jgi:DnaJ-class molecular chaperone
MRCGFCHGTGVRIVPETPNAIDLVVVICDECQGSGIAYCCDDAGVNHPNTFDDGVSK